MTVEWRRLAAREVDHELVWGLVGVASAVAAGFRLLSGPLPPMLCPFREMTGLPCPTCGATRAGLELLAGHVLLAFRMNPPAAALLLAVVPYLAYALTVSWLDLPRLRLRFSPRDWLLCRGAAAAVVVATWAFLIVDGR
jgi:hypothetical protein